MADAKTSQLTALSATPASNDLLMVVDVSDTTMAASGTNKKLLASYVARSDAGAKLITGSGLELTVPATGTAALITTGTWTPAITPGAGSGHTYSTQIGRYIKIGTLVIAGFKIILAGKGTISGSLTLGGLPVTVDNVAGYDPSSALLVDYVSYTAGLVTYAVPVVNGTSCYLVKANGTGANGLLQASDIGANTAMSGQIIYQSAT